MWSAPPGFVYDRGALVISTLSLLLAAESLAAVELHVDNSSAAVARALGWDAIARICHTLPDSHPLAWVWSLGKFIALAHAEVACVHMDTDVLLFRGLPARFNAPGFIAQSAEPPEWYAGDNFERVKDLLAFPRGKRAYNGGLLGYGATDSIAVLRAYAAGALDRSSLLARWQSEIDGTTATMVVEQYYLGVFASSRGIPVHTLFASHVPSPAEAFAAGYTHLIGSAKRAPEYVSKCEARLARDWPEEWGRFKDGWERLAGDQPRLAR